MARFEMHLGANYAPDWICSLSDEELAAEIVKTEWDPDLMRDLFWRADMLDQWEAMDEWDDDLCRKAAEALGVPSETNQRRTPPMTDTQITHAFSEAPHYTDPDAFIIDLLLSAAFLPPDDPEADPDLTQTDALRRIWQAVNLPFKALLTEMGLTQTSLSKRYGIPLRTVQDWAGERRTPSLWLRLMLADLAGWLEREP